MFARLVAPFAEGDAPLAVVFFYINIFPLRNDSTYFTQLNKYRGRRDSIDALPLVRENSTSKEKEPRYVAFAFRAFALSLSLFACLRAFFIHSKFCIDVVSSSRGHPRGDVALILSERGRHRCETHARAFPRKSHRKKKERARFAFLSFFLPRCRAQKHGRKALALPQNKEISLFLPFRQLIH